MIFFQLKKLEFINQIQKFTICQSKNVQIQKGRSSFLSANTWDVLVEEIMATVLFGLTEIIIFLITLTTNQKTKEELKTVT